MQPALAAIALWSLTLEKSRRPVQGVMAHSPASHSPGEHLSAITMPPADAGPEDDPTPERARGVASRHRRAANSSASLAIPHWRLAERRLDVAIDAGDR